MKAVLWGLSLLVVSLLEFGSCQSPGASPPSLADIITPTAIPPNEALLKLFSIGIIRSQTPVAVRYTLFTALSAYDLMAACHPIALSFFGTKDVIPRKFCTDRDSFAVIRVLTVHRLIASEFPIEARIFGAFLVQNGLNIVTTSTDRNTREGYANFLAHRLVEYFSSDGWNSQGDLTRTDFRERFSDPSGYEPKNPGNLEPSKLRRPLRWQPLRSEADGRGNFVTQIHITPHLGSSAKPLALTPAELKSRRVPGPYATPDKPRSIGASDKKKLLGMIKKILKINAKLTTQKIATALWWENKFLSLGNVVIFYGAALQLPPDQDLAMATGDLLAQYDAVLVAWKEKVRHDLVRPTTVIRGLLRGKKVRAFRGFGKGVGLVKAEEWEPLVQVQPHSEYPSASATICESSIEHTLTGLRTILGKNVTIPPFEFSLPPGFMPNLPPDIPFSIKLSADALSRSCGSSRLLAGVHFPPAVTAGRKVAQGVGKKAFQHMNSLFNGKVPEDCARCIKS